MLNKIQSICLFLLYTISITLGSALKGNLQLIPDVEEYNLLVKFSSSSVPTVDEQGNLTLGYKAPTYALNRLIQKHSLTFSYALKFSQEDLINLQTEKRFEKDQKEFNIYDFAGLLYVESTDKSKESLLNIASGLETLTEVEYCSLEPAEHAPPPEDYPPTTPNLVDRQTYRGPNPGIDVVYAWTRNLKGKGLLICDLEWSWGDMKHSTKSIHEDLFDQDIKHGLPKKTDEYEDHGVAVMGLLLAVENNYGIHGSVPEARGLVFPEHHGRAAALLAAIDSCKKGDIILLEMQTKGADGKLCPADYAKSVWDATKAGTDAGVVIVGTAGNGGANLDASSYASYRARGDNGVIMSGAGSADRNHNKLGYSTYGRDHVHIQGWGEKVFTLGYGDHAKYGNDPHQEYTRRFSGTSSSGPISTSAAALVQSYAIEYLDTLFTSREIRKLLVETGIPQGSGGHIGPLPNLRAAIERLDSLHTPIREKRIKANRQECNLYAIHKGIQYFVPQIQNATSAEVHIDLYDLKGGRIKTLVHESKQTNELYTLAFNSETKVIPAGVYLCRMSTQGFKQAFKVTVK